MSFIGLVTRKEQDTGVLLEAKIVTPNKKKYVRQQFEVRVKKKVLDDLSSCIIDMNTVKVNIEGQLDANDGQIIDSIGLPYTGVNGTVISYRVIDDGAPLLSNYLTADGNANDKPKFGEGDAKGYLEITVAKGEESEVSTIPVIIRAVSAMEVLTSETFTKPVLWSIIKGSNDSYQNGESSGSNNIANSLNLKKTQEVPDKSVKPVKIEWSVVDDTLDYATSKGLYEKPRIDVDTGAITRIAYKDACSMIDSIYGVNIQVISKYGNVQADPLRKRVRIGGLTLKALLSLEGETATSEVVFSCSTISKYITVDEVMEAVVAGLVVNTPDTTNGYQPFKTAADGVFTTVPGTALTTGEYQFTVPRDGMSLSSDTLKINVGEMAGVDIKTSIRDANATSEYDPVVLATAFQIDTQSSADTVVTINIDNMKAQPESKKTFTVYADITVSGYSNDGVAIAAGTKTNYAYCQLRINAVSA